MSSRVLIVGGRAQALAERLEARGYVCEAAPRAADINASAARNRPDAVVLAVASRAAAATLRLVRDHAELKGVPVLLEGEKRSKTLDKLDVDGFATTLDELELQLKASLRARRSNDREELVRRRLELLLEVNNAVRVAEPLPSLAQRVAGQLKRALSAEHAAILRVEGEGTKKAVLIDGASTTPVDLAVSPTLRRALETQQPVVSDDTYVHPFPGEFDGAVALFVKRSLPLEPEEKDFVAAVGSALAHALEAERVAHEGASSRQSLEAAYVDRYRELVEANQRLTALDRKKNELLAVLSHDLRAPLNVLLGHSYILLTDGDLKPDMRPSAVAIQRTSKKVLELVETLLEKSHDEDGRIVLFTKTMDVAETAQETVAELQILAREKNVKLRVEAPMSLMVLGDEQKIRQVFQNLITNALTHSKDAKEIVVRARLKPRPDGDVALMEVRDDGIVSDPNDLLLAFERSRGLGLAICRDYVERHGGEIWAETPKQGGAMFSFTLPINSERVVQPPAPRNDAPLVLLADADPVFGRSCTMAFSGHYRIELARDGDEAVKKARALLPDVVVMDVFMPRRDGLDALRELRSRPETSRIPVVLVSGNAKLTEKLRTSDLGAMGALTKPFPMSVLLSRVSEVLHRSARFQGGPGNDLETGLFDHVGVVNRLEQELSRSVRYGRPLTLAMLKPRMPPGDKTRELALRLRREIRTPDVAAHLGQGTFAVLLPETPTEAARPLIGRLVASLEQEGVSFVSRLVDVKEGAGSAEQLLEQLLA